jgi:predicted transcriptional regulator of viral defense system
MKKEAPKRQYLSDYVDSLQSKGMLTFTGKSALSNLSVTRTAFNRAAERLIQKKRLIHPARGFYVIVPIDKQLSGAPDPSWFIDALMKYHGQPYYVGGLSAASFLGASHQATQEFQIITNSPLKQIVTGRTRIRFLTKKWIERTPTQPLKTPAGFIPISTPEATVFDLIQYIRWMGHLNNVATVLVELFENLNKKKLLAIAKLCGEVAVAQRLGYLLDRFADRKITSELHSWVADQEPNFAPLRPNWKSELRTKDTKWRLIVNETVEPDL